MLELILFVLLVVQTADPGAAGRAERLYRAGDWTEAARAYAVLAEENPGNGLFWYRLGVARHQQGEHRAAIEAYRRAESLGFSPLFTRYNLAAALARSGNLDEAFELLSKVAASGFRNESLLDTDEDLARLRSDPRWREIRATVERNAHPCRDPRFRKLDFWIGEWEVQDTGSGTVVGSSTIESILDGCVILENWRGRQGDEGKSFNTIDPATGKWRQTWSDNAARIYDFVGDPGENAMVYSRDVTGPAGEPQIIRMTLSTLPEGRVHQLSERSADGGATWTVNYDFTYVPKKE